MKRKEKKTDSLLLSLETIDNPLNIPLDAVSIQSLQAAILAKKEGERTRRDELLLIYFRLLLEERLDWDNAIGLLVACKGKTVPPFALFLLGECFRLGIPPFGKDEERAKNLFRQAHAKKFPDAASRLLSLKSIRGKERRRLLASKPFFRKDRISQEILARTLIASGKRKEGRKVLEKLLEQGDDKVFLPLVDSLLSEKTEESNREAFHWLLSGVEENRREAFYPLAECYRLGRGTKKDSKEAWLLYRRSQDDVHSLLFLAKEHERRGETHLACREYHKAAKMGSWRGKVHYAILSAKSPNPLERRDGFQLLLALSAKEPSLDKVLSRLYARLYQGDASAHYLLSGLKRLDEDQIFLSLTTGRRKREGWKAFLRLKAMGKSDRLEKRLSAFQEEDERAKAEGRKGFSALKENLSFS